MRRGIAWLMAALFLLLCACGDSNAAQQAEPPEAEIPLTETPEEEATTEGSIEVQEPLSPVYADWSQLGTGAGGETVGGLYWDEPLEQLKADDGYGMLVPYIGRELRVIWDETSSWEQYRYGLATADGLVVTEPVYDQIRQPAWNNEAQYPVSLPVYILWATVAVPGQEEPQRRCAVAAQDGSWCTETAYLGAAAIGPDRMLLVDTDQMTWFCDLEGNITPTAVARPMDEIWIRDWHEVMNISGPLALLPMTGGGGNFVNFDTGEVVSVEGANFATWNGENRLLPVYGVDGQGYLNRSGEWAFPPTYDHVGDFYCGHALVRETEDGPTVMIDETGRAMLSSDGSINLCVVGDSVCWVVCDDDGQVERVLDAALRDILPKAVGGTLQDAWNAIAWQDADGNGWYWDGHNVYALPDGKVTVDNCGDGWALLSRPYPDSNDYDTLKAFYDPVSGQYTMEPVPIRNSRLYVVDGAPYLRIGIDGGRVIDGRGRQLFGGAWIGEPAGGLFPVVDGSWTGLRNIEGDWILRIPLDTAGD